MKKYIFFFFFFLFLASQAKGQLSDIVGLFGGAIEKGAMVEHLKNIENSTKVLKASEESLTKVKEALEATKGYLNKVNAVIQKVNYIEKAKTLINRAKAARERTNWMIERSMDQITKKDLDGFLSRGASLLTTLTENLSLINDVLSDGKLKMSDFERLTYLDGKFKQIEEETYAIEYEEYSIARNIATEAVYDSMKKK